MSELMPCQMCGGEAELYDDSETVYIYFVNCDCTSHGPTFEAIETGVKDQVRSRAIVAWNDMQTLIARGKLLDEPSSPSTKARL